MVRNDYLPRNKLDAIIGSYIMSHNNDDYSDVIRNDTRLETARYLGRAANGLFAWYPFKINSDVLVIGSTFGSFIDNISKRCRNVCVLESDGFRANCVKHRMRGHSNVLVEITDINDFDCNRKYDYVIFLVEEYSRKLKNKIDYANVFSNIKLHLNNNGTLLSVIPNRIGVKYLCGEFDENNDSYFDGITDDSSYIYRFDMNELSTFLSGECFRSYKIYSLFPDYLTPQLIYTDEYKPEIDIMERLKVYVSRGEKRFISERKLCGILARNNVLGVFSNQFIVECSYDTCCNVTYAAISGDRNRDRAFTTVICDDDTVKKIPIYSEGLKGIKKLYENACEQRNHNVPSLSISIKDNMAVMKKVNYPTLSNYIRKIVHSGNATELIKCTDLIYKYILASSEHVELNSFKYLAPNEDWGIILKKAYIEMIPVNCFMLENDLLFYDQEFTYDNCPAGYVMFRALHDIYMFIPETEQLIPIKEMKKKYSIDNLWNIFMKIEVEFCHRLVSADIYTGRHIWLSDNEDVQRRNRKVVTMDNQNKIRMFDPIFDLNGEQIILFGSGKLADEYLEKYGEQYRPIFYIDNNPGKWGSERNGIPIKSPDSIKNLIYGSYRIIIAINDYRTVENQLCSMGIGKDYYRIYNKQIIDLLPAAICDTMSDNKYNIGYITGAFDLFHIGHLNVLKNSKSRCHYLIAGVLTDQIIIDEKHKTPFVPFEERIEIVKQCKYVDRVVAVDKHNTNKLDAWKELKFGCLFSGSDHASQPGWLRLQAQLRSLGSELEFFPYTQSTSSTMLQQAIRNEIKEK